MSDGAKEVPISPPVEADPLDDEMRQIFSKEYDNVPIDLDEEAKTRYLADNAGRQKYIESQISDSWNIADIIQKAEFQKFIDPLTQLPNRRGFDLILRMTYKKLENYPDAKLYLMAFDLDHFKKVNDTYGHDVGDQVLVAIAGRLKGDIRTGDSVARLGGEEFAALAVDYGPNTFETQQTEPLIPSVMANRLNVDMRLAVASKTPIKNQSSSIGLVEITRDPVTRKFMDSAEALKRADIASYQAKQLGRNRVVLFQEGMTMPAKAT